MGQAMHADALRAVICLPVAVTDAHVVRCALPVPITGIRALCFDTADEGRAQQRREKQKYLSHS